MLIDFLQVTQECVLLGFFNTLEESGSLVSFAREVFANEIELEKKFMAQQWDKENMGGE